MHVLTTATRAPRASRNGNGRPHTPEELSAGWTITKRDGRKEPFDVAKVRKALGKCFAGIDLPTFDGATVDRLATRVVNFLDAQGMTAPTVEEVQNAVITQLWSEGLDEAATHYTLYREERRKARESRPIPAEVARLIEEDAAHFPTPLEYYQFVSKFSRWRDADKRRETWGEANDRVFGWFATLPQFRFLKAEEVAWLRRMMFERKASPALRVLQMAGPALERCHVGCYNCAYHPILDLFAFAELLYILMQGSGNGFSVEVDYVGELPRVQKQKKPAVVHAYKVEDTTEGWCDALLFGLQKWFAGEDVEFDVTGVRKTGTRLKTKGGRASGPGPLVELLKFTRATVLNAQGRHLTDLEVHDVCCYIGKIVQVGGVRRASCISLSDLNSVAMRECKHGNYYIANGQRAMANNSAVYEERPPVEVFMEEWLALVKSKSGERGIFNRAAARILKPVRRKDWKFGANPCCEILLRPFQFCNLTIAILRGHETVEEMAEKVRAATYFGVIQSCATKFNYIRKEWKKNCEEERLLGVDIMGHLDHPLLRPGAPGRDKVVQYLKQVVADTAKELSERLGINYSAANTCLKPGGDSGEFFNTVSLAPEYGKYKIRRTREAVYSPVAHFLKAAGVPCEPAAEDPAGLLAFAWPKKAPEGRPTRHDLTAVEQLENWLFWQENWAEHSCSTTIYVKEHEWPVVGAWVWEHFDRITGLSFLPWDNGTHSTMPHEEVSAEKYNELVAAFPRLEWSKLMRYEDEDMTTGSQTYACTAGGCERI